MEIDCVYRYPDMNHLIGKLSIFFLVLVSEPFWLCRKFKRYVYALFRKGTGFNCSNEMLFDRFGNVEIQVSTIAAFANINFNLFGH